MENDTFDFEQVKKDAEKVAKEAEKKYIQDKRMKHVADISKDLKPISPTNFSNPTKEQKDKLQKLEAKDGKIVLNDKNKEPEPEIQQQKMESMEEWQILIKEKYDNLKKVIDNNLPQLWLSVEFILAVKSIMNIQGVTLPWLGILLGRASSLKTAGIEMLRDTINTFYTDIFTAKAFVSNSTAVSKDKLKDIDMLPKIKNKLFLVSELSAQFTKKEEEVQEILGIFVRLADGHGLKINTGAHGERGYRDTYFNMIGAAVDIPYKVYRLLGSLGPKLYFLRLPKIDKKEDEYLTEMFEDEYPIKFAKVKQALNDYLNIFVMCPDMLLEKESKLSRIQWSKNDDKETSRLIIRMSILLSHLRAVVTTFGDTYGHGGLDYAYATTQREEPSRAIIQLRNLARGFALSKGRTHITMEDITLVIKVVLSTAPIDRVNVFDLLIAHKGILKTSTIEMSLNMSKTTAKRTMTELKAIELVGKPEPDPNDSSHELQIKLNDSFDWFLREQFASLREGFIPIDNRDEMKDKLKKKDKKVSEDGIPPNCYYCDFNPETKKEYESHIVKKHAGKLAYPGPADMKASSIEPQGMKWES